MKERPKRPVSDTYTEITKIVKNANINGNNRLFGGDLMQWIDETAAVSAMRLCGGNVTTASVDHLVFRKGAKLNDIIVIKAKVTYVGRTSMEVRADTWIWDKFTGRYRVINHAYLTEVYIDENDNPKEIPYDIELNSINDKAEYRGALKRKSIRHERRTDFF